MLSTKSSVVILISEDFNGHRLSYLTGIIERCRQLDISLHIVTLVEPKIDVNLDFSEVCFHLVTGGRREIFLKAKALQRKLSESRIIAWEIERWYLYLLCHRVPLFGLAMRPYLSFANPRALINSLVKIFLNRFFSFRSEVKIRGLSIPNHFHKFSKNWVDELPLKFENQDQFRISNSENRTISFGVYGSISNRKRPIDCIKFAETVSEITDLEVEIKFVGKIGDDIDLQKMKSSKIRVTIVNEYLSDYQYFNSMKSMDYILCFYKNIGSARTPIEAISTGTCCIFLDSSNRWGQLEKDFPSNFVRISHLRYALSAFKTANSMNHGAKFGTWLPRSDTWLDYLVGKIL